MSPRSIRAARPASRGGNEKAASLPGATVGPISVAPRRADRESWGRVSVQVSDSLTKRVEHQQMNDTHLFINRQHLVLGPRQVEVCLLRFTKNTRQVHFFNDTI